MNVRSPNDVLPLMSVARHRNVVVLVMWKTWPGSRGPVESQAVELSVGVAPLVV